MKGKAYIVAGLLYGDEGKGTITDWLVREHEATTVVRYNGGPQAAHNVVTDDNRHHTFAQWGAGTFVPDVATYLSRYMMINPLNFFPEEEHLRKMGITDAWDRLYVSPDCIVITPWHACVNRIRETLRGGGRHGSCGQGIDETMRDLMKGHVIMTRDLFRGHWLPQTLEQTRMRMEKMATDLMLSYGVTSEDQPLLAKDFRELSDPDSVWRCRETYLDFTDRIGLQDKIWDETVVFEGAQGVLLGEELGEAPNITWGRTTFANAMQLASGYDVQRIGVMRPYMTRHGDGPFEEDGGITRYVRAMGPEHNQDNLWQGNFKCGRMDLNRLNYVADNIGRLNQLAITCLDHFPHDAGAIPKYAELFGTNQVIESRGPAAKDKELVRYAKAY